MRFPFRKIAVASAAVGAIALMMVPRLAAAQDPPRGSSVYAPWFAQEEALRQKLLRMHPNKRTTNPLAAGVSDYLIHTFPYVGIDPNRIPAAIAQRNLMAANVYGITGATAVSTKAVPVWQPVGPTILDPPADEPYGSGPYPIAGRVSGLAYDPVTKGKYYITSATGGIWRSTNYGLNWTQLTDTNPYSISFSSIAIDPTNTNILYAGTGDYDYTKHFGNGLLKSTNGGATWTNISMLGNTQIFGTHTIRRILIDPNNHNHILVALGRNVDWVTAANFTLGLLQTPPAFLPPGPLGGAVFNSLNGGATWTQTLPAPGPQLAGYVDELAYNTTGTILYAGVDFQGVYKSTDNGLTWTKLTYTFNDMGTTTGPSVINGYANNINGFESARVLVAASTVDANTVYALSEDQLKLFKSTNAGTTWTDASGDWTTVGDISQTPYDFYLACGKVTTYPNGTKASGVSVDGLYIGLTDILQSTNGGNDWTPILDVYTGQDIAHTDQHALTFNPTNPNEMLIGNDGGIYRMTFAPAVNGITAVGLNSTLETTDFYTQASAFLDPSQLLGGMQDNSIGHADDNLVTWTNPGEGDGGSVLINPLNALIQYGMANQYYVFVTGNDWVTQTEIDPPVPTNPTEPAQFPDAPMVFDPLNPDYVYYGTDYLYQYQYSKNQWTKGPLIELPAPFFDPNDYVTAIAVSPLNDQIMVAGTLDGLMFVTETGFGGTWMECDGGLPERSITSIVFSTLPQAGAVPDVTTRVFVTMGGAGGKSHVYKTSDLLAPFLPLPPGDTIPFQPNWTAIGGTGTGALPDVNVSSLVVLPHTNEATMYVANDIGVFATANGGTTWTNAGNPFGLPTGLIVKQLNFEASTGYLNASTYGRAQWRLPIGNVNELQIYLNLQGYRGSRSALTVTADIYNQGQTLPLLEEKTLPITASGWFEPILSAQGTFDVLIKLPRFLHKRIKNVASPGSQFISPLILAGDCAPNGVDPITGLTIYGDNVVDMNDVTWVLDHMGLYSHTTADIDGDGIVTQHDLDLVMANFGMTGDN